MFYAPITILIWMVIVVFAIAALLILAGTSGLTWADPGNAIAVLLLGTSLVLHGVFVAGASTFGPVHEINVGADPDFGNTVYLYTDVWKTSYHGHQRIETRLELVGDFPDAMTDTDRNLYESCITYCLDHNKEVFPIHVQISSWDSHIYYMKFTHVNPPVVIGQRARLRLEPFIELLTGTAVWWLAVAIWREGRRRGIRLRIYDPFAFLSDPKQVSSAPEHS